MTSHIVRSTLLILAVTALLLSVAPAVNAQDSAACSNATEAGKWAFTLTGNLLLSTGPVPVGAVGRLSVDAEGVISGTEWRNVGGGFGKESIKGTWAVNADCTAGVTVQIFDQLGNLVRTSVLDAVFSSNSSQIRAVQESLVIPGVGPVPVVITLEGNRLFNQDSQ